MKNRPVVRKRVRRKEGILLKSKRDPKCDQAEAAVICLNRISAPYVIYVIAKHRCVDGYTFYRSICFYLVVQSNLYSYAANANGFE